MPDTHLPRKIGRFEQVEVIDAGGYGIVFRPWIL